MKIFIHQTRHIRFLLALIELFFSIGVTAEALRRANIGSKSAISLQRGPVDPKFHVEGVAPINHSSSQKTRLNDDPVQIFIPYERSLNDLS